MVEIVAFAAPFVHAAVRNLAALIFAAVTPVV